MDKSQYFKIVISCVAILAALVTAGVYLTGGDEVTSNDLRSIVKSLPDEELIQMRQMLAAQVAEANRTRKGEKSSILVGYEQQLADYDEILRERDIDPEKLKVPTYAEMPMRKDEGP